MGRTRYRQLELKERARDHKYLYTDKETFLAALELYNRQGCTILKQTLHGMTFDQCRVLRKWEKRQVAGYHRKPCSQCGHEFVKDKDDYYLVENHDGPYDAEKNCMGCMARILCFKYGTNKTEILSQLAPSREKQKKIYCDLRNYQDDSSGEFRSREWESFLFRYCTR
jgi:hypothetical protein